MIVQIAARGQAVPRLGQYRGRHLFRRGLPVAARNANQRNRELAAPMVRAALQRSLRVRDDDLRDRDSLLGIDHRPRGSRGKCHAHELIGVEARPPQRDEQLALLQGTGVARHAGEGLVSTAQRTAARRRKVFQSAPHGRAPSSAARTTA